MEIAPGATQSFVIDDGNTIYLRTTGVADYVIMPFGSTANQVTGSINSTQGVVNLGPIYNQSVVRITATNGSCEYSNDLIESPAVVGTVNDSHELSDVVRAVTNPVTGGIEVSAGSLRRVRQRQAGSKAFGLAKIGFLGASITNGSSSSNAGSTSMRALAIANADRTKVLNDYSVAAYPGTPASEIANNIGSLLDTGVTEVIVGPDWATNGITVMSHAQYIDATERVIDACDRQGVDVSFCLTIPCGAGSNVDQTVLARRNAYLIYNVGARGYKIIDTASAVRGSDGFLAPAYFTVGDLIHPNDAGHAVLAAVVTQYLNAKYAAISWPVDASGYGMLTNPLFATDSDSNGTADGWSVLSPGYTITRTLSASDKVPGGKWQKLSASSVSSASTVFGQAVAVTAGEKYIVAGIAEKESGDLSVDLCVLNSANNQIIYNLSGSLASGAGPKMAIALVTIPTGVASITVGLRLSGSIGQSAVAYIGSTNVFSETAISADLNAA